MGLENLMTYVEDMIGWFSFALVCLVVVLTITVGYLRDRIRRLEIQMYDVWKWAELSEKTDENLNNRLKNVETRF